MSWQKSNADKSNLIKTHFDLPFGHIGYPASNLEFTYFAYKTSEVILLIQINVTLSNTSIFNIIAIRITLLIKKLDSLTDEEFFS